MRLEVGVVVFFEVIVVGVGVGAVGVVMVDMCLGDVRGRCSLFGTCWGGGFEGPEGL